MARQTFQFYSPEVETVLSEGLSELRGGFVNDAESEAFRIKYLGAKGRVKGLLEILRSVPPEKRVAANSQIWAVRQTLIRDFEAAKSRIPRLTCA